jgi:Protein of unknown function (DUF3300)
MLTSVVVYTLGANMALRRVVTLVAALLLLTPVAVTAQTPAATSPSTDQLLKPEQLDALVAPIALYPDNLLSLVLMASTYPLEVVQADRWVTEHKKLKGEQLKAEVDKQGWDDSVKSLVPTPDVLSMMSKKLDWTLTQSSPNKRMSWTPFSACGRRPRPTTS